TKVKQLGHLASTISRTSRRFRLQPPLATEYEEESRGHHEDGHRRDDESGVGCESGIGDVHPVPAGDERRHRDDRGPTGYFLHHLVLAVVAQTEVRLDDCAHEI